MNNRSVLAALCALGLGCSTGRIGGAQSGAGGSSEPNDPGIIDLPGSGGGAITGGGGVPGTAACTPGSPPVTTRLFRLTHAQYDNTVRALTGLDVHPSADFPADQNQAGFDRGMDLVVGDAL